MLRVCTALNVCNLSLFPTRTHTHTHTPTVIPTPLRVQMVRCVMLLLPDENRYALQHLLTLLEDISERTHLNQVCVCGVCVVCVCAFINSVRMYIFVSDS